MVNESHPALVRAIAEIAGESSVAFNPSTATVLWDDKVITPDNYANIEQADVKAFATAIYTYNNGEWANVYAALQADLVQPDREPVPLTAEEEKELERSKIIKTFEDGVKALTSGYTDDEVKSWDAKRRESEIILSGSGEATPTIDAIVQALGLDRTEYAQLIQQKAQAYGAQYGALEATMKRDLEALEDASPAS
jgi:hypothetical protein